MSRGWIFVISAILTVALLAALAPRDQNQAVPTTSWAIQLCQGAWHDDGPPVSIILTSDAGPYNIYQVTCRDGLQQTVAH